MPFPSFFPPLPASGVPRIKQAAIGRSEIEGGANGIPQSATTPVIS